MQLHFSISNRNVVAQLCNEEKKIVFTKQCEVQNLCENIANLFECVDKFLLNNEQTMPYDKQHIFFDFDKQRNITTARIILSFIAGLNIKSKQ